MGFCYIKQEIIVHGIRGSWDVGISDETTLDMQHQALTANLLPGERGVTSQQTDEALALVKK